MITAFENCDEWTEPDESIFEDRRGDLPAFPVDVLTPPWGDWLLRAAHGAGVRPEHVAVPLLGVASSLIGTARRVRASPSWSEPFTLWTCVVAASGDRKTPGLNVTLRALNRIERERSAAVDAARLAHETRRQIAKEAVREWKERRRAAQNARPPQSAPAMPMEAIDPGDFIYPRLYATDSTIESLAPLLEKRPRGALLVRDELSGLFGNMGRYSRGNDRPFWLEAWNGNRHVVERVSKSSVIEHLLIGVIGGFQPDKIARAFQGDEDGMSGRFLFAWPSPPAYRPLANDVSEVEPPLLNALKALVQLPAEDAKGAFAAQVVCLSDAAVATFEEFRKFIDVTKRSLEGLERQWLVKAETQCLRLAGTLAFMDWAIMRGPAATNGVKGIIGALEPDVIDEQFMTSAIRLLTGFFWPHARAALRQIGLSDRHRNARRVLRWIQVHRKSVVSVREVRREALGQCIDAEQTIVLLDSLVKARWLRKETTKTAGRPICRWIVNPTILIAESAESAEGSNPAGRG
jgi:hypothetical protein